MVGSRQSRTILFLLEEGQGETFWGKSVYPAKEERRKIGLAAIVTGREGKKESRRNRGNSCSSSTQGRDLPLHDENQCGRG